MAYKLHVIYKGIWPIKVYINETNTRAICFYLFGRYSSIRSDCNALDLAVDFHLNRSDAPTVIGFEAYKNSLDDTQVIDLNEINKAS